ncbi:unnamed protein product, partial [Rotaria sp. Silwood2]
MTIPTVEENITEFMLTEAIFSLMKNASKID